MVVATLPAEPSAADFLPLTDARAEAFVRHFTQTILSQLSRFRLPADLAEDAAQECLLRALRGLPGFRGEARLTTWVYRIAHNEGVRARHRWQRRREREAPWSAAPEAAAAPATSALEQQDQRQQLRRLLDTLPDNHRLALGYHYLDGLSVAEIAKICGAAEGTVKAWLKRGRDRLRQQFPMDPT